MLNRIFTITLGVTLTAALAMAQQPAAGPHCKDDAECDLYTKSQNEKDPAKKLAILDQWSEKYADSDFKDVRNYLYITSYSGLAGGATAPNASADAMAAGEKAAHTLIDKADTFFAPDIKMKSVTDAQWTQAKTAVLVQAHQALASASLAKKDYPTLETQAKALLQMNPNDALACYWLGTAIVLQKNTDRFPEAIFYLARSVSITGQGALVPAMAKPADAYLTKVYNTYHGSSKDLDAVKAIAAKSPTPPADFKIVSVTDISKAEIAQEEQFLKDHPKIAEWRAIKATLTADGGDAYFNDKMKGLALPDLVGKVVSQPDQKTLTLSIDNATPETLQKAEVTLVFDSPLKGTVPPGTELTFTGTAKAFTKEPFMVTFDVEKADVKGLGDAAGPATPTKRKAPAKKAGTKKS